MSRLYTNSKEGSLEVRINFGYDMEIPTELENILLEVK